MSPTDLEVSKDAEIFQSAMWWELGPQGASGAKNRPVPLMGSPEMHGSNKAMTLRRQVGMELLEVGTAGIF